MTTVQQYQDAFRKNEAARQAVKSKVKAASEIASAMTYHLRSFLGFNFNIRIDNSTQRFDPKGRVDVSGWPSADELKAVFHAWNEADSALRAVWASIPESDRDALAPPPPAMTL